MSYKKTHLQLYADECFPFPTVTYLKSLGVSIIHAYTLKIINKPDLYHLEQSKKLQRVLITLDRDFTYNKATLRGYLGVIVISSGSRGYLAVNDICRRSLKKITPDYVKNSWVVVTKTKIVRHRNRSVDEKLF